MIAIRGIGCSKSGRRSSRETPYVVYGEVCYVGMLSGVPAFSSEAAHCTTLYGLMYRPSEQDVDATSSRVEMSYMYAPELLDHGLRIALLYDALERKAK
jgi:hypothetical protein